MIYFTYILACFAPSIIAANINSRFDSFDDMKNTANNNILVDSTQQQQLRSSTTNYNTITDDSLVSKFKTVFASTRLLDGKTTSLSEEGNGRSETASSCPNDCYGIIIYNI